MNPYEPVFGNKVGSALLSLVESRKIRITLARGDSREKGR